MGTRGEDRLVYADAEVVIGLVAPLGTNLSFVEKTLADRLPQFGYAYQHIRLSELFSTFTLEVQERGDGPAARSHHKMDLGNALRERARRFDALAVAGLAEIRKKRPPEGPAPRTAFVLRQLKHPQEVQTLREIYGPGFFLLGATASMESRKKYLVKNMGMSEGEARELIERDTEEDTKEFGQRTRNAFELADAFVSVDEDDSQEQVWRILDLMFGSAFHTPTRDEFGMFMAYAASLRSADLSRQVGAVVMTNHGEILATGTNDVPRFGGGLYWPGELLGREGDHDDKTQRDFVRGFDSNAAERDEIIDGITNDFLSDAGGDPSGTIRARLQAALRSSQLMELTEFGRPVHAEMEALLACARVGTAVRDQLLFTTTFPCHNCTKHIVAAGIRRVVYVEPYPKSKAKQLHGDAIAVPGVEDGEQIGQRVSFEPFKGIGPRRFIDLFSLKLGDGKVLKRKDKSTGKRIDYVRSNASPRVPMQPTSYLEREQVALSSLDKAIEGENGDDGQKKPQHS
jgi:deoxycytidylate deaminase